MNPFLGDMKQRMENVRKWMEKEDLDALILTPGDNFYYLTSFDTEPMERITMFLVTMNEEKIICPLMLEEQVKSQSWVDNIETWKDGEDPNDLIAEAIKHYKISKAGIEGSASYVLVTRMKEMGIDDFVISDEMFSNLRNRKSGAEIEAITQAIRKSEKAYGDALGEIREGMTESELAGILEYNFRKQSLGKLAFSSIVAFGENSAIPHHEPSERKLKKGDVVLMDFGGKYTGYSSDTTRTAAFDHLDEKMRQIYYIVKDSQEYTIDAINENTRYCDVDQMARDRISSGGYGANFIHRIGHGLGIAVHENPYLVPENKDLLVNQSVFTIEPGVYLPGKGGVRIEDTVMFKDGRCIPFNRLEKELIVL